MPRLKNRLSLRSMKEVGFETLTILIVSKSAVKNVDTCIIHSLMTDTYVVNLKNSVP